jgi:integrase
VACLLTPSRSAYQAAQGWPGELCALRWKDVDLDAARIRIEKSLEQTNAGLRLKEPKTKAGRRSVSIPPAVVAELRAHWRTQQEQRLAMGTGRAPDDARSSPEWTARRYHLIR